MGTRHVSFETKFVGKVKKEKEKKGSCLSVKQITNA